MISFEGDLYIALTGLDDDVGFTQELRPAMVWNKDKYTFKKKFETNGGLDNLGFRNTFN